MYHPYSEGYYKCMSCQVSIPQSVAHLHRKTMLKDRAIKWRTLEKTVMTCKDMEIKEGKCFLEASSTATNKNHIVIL